MFQYVVENWFEIIEIIGLIIAIAAAVSAMTPTPKDDTFVRKAKKVLDIVALNVGKAKNKDDQ